MGRRGNTTAIAERGDLRSLHVRFPLQEPERVVTQVLAALGGGSVRTVCVDLAGLESIDPRGLQALLAVAAAARAAGAEAQCVHVRAPVYKALHLAGVGGRLKRVREATGPA